MEYSTSFQSKKRRQLVGQVVSDKMAKTVVVRVGQLKRDSKYRRYYKISKKFKAHDEEKHYRVGDKVVIEETRPLSKEKRWKVVKLVERPPAEVEESSELKSKN